MLELPKITWDPKLTEHLCKCRPICNSRRREWKGQIQPTTEELLLERKPLPPCHRRWPSKVYPNSPCPLRRRVKGITIKELKTIPKRHVVRVCTAPIDNTADTTYLWFANVARSLGAWDAVQRGCPFCSCCGCCPCAKHGYVIHDAERESRRRTDMRQFDARVKHDYQKMRIMY